MDGSCSRRDDNRLNTMNVEERRYGEEKNTERTKSRRNIFHSVFFFLFSFFSHPQTVQQTDYTHTVRRIKKKKNRTI